MDDSSSMATSTIDIEKSIVPEGILSDSSQTTQQIVNNEINVDQASSSPVNGETAAISEEISSVGDHTSAGLLAHKPTTQSPSDMTTQAAIASTMDTIAKPPLLTTTAITTGISKISTKDINTSQASSDVHLSASVPSINDTSTTAMKTSIQTDITNTGTDNTFIDGSTMEEKISPSLSTTHNVTMATANAGSSSVTHPANTAVGCSAELTAAACIPKLEPSTLSKVKVEPRDFDNITFPKPILPVTGASGYNSSKVAAEMAKIDLFLASLAKGGIGSNTMPNVKVKTETAAVMKPAPVGSALGNIALSYGYSEEESSSSSSDESEDDKLVNVRSTKMNATAAVVAMDTHEVEQSMKKVAVSDSSSSSSEDELG